MSGELRRVEISGQSFLVHERPDGLWDKIARREWEPQTEEVLGQLKEDDLFVDVGAWIGWTTLAAAAQGATVLAFEPDPVSRVELEANIAANPGRKVTVVPAALSNKAGTMQLTAPYELGDSMGSIVRHSRVEEGKRATEVRVDEVRDWLPQFEGARLIKVDTEGAEYRIIPAMRSWLTEHKPDLMLSLHTYHLNGIVNRLPSRVRPAASRVVTLALRSRLRWLGSIYPEVMLEQDKAWRPLDAGGFRRALDRPGESEILLRSR